MSLSNYVASINSSYAFLDDARDSFTWDKYYGDWKSLYNGVKRPVDSSILSNWEFKCNLSVPFRLPISRLSSFERLEVTERILNEL